MSLEHTALVLEGGGLRGIFSAGVLDALLEHDIHFPYVIGVSMGACNGVSYVSKQPGRSLRIPYTYLGREPRYMSLRSFLRTGNLFGMEFIFDEVPHTLDPFDFDTFERSPQEFVLVVTDVQSGKPAYFGKHDLARDEFLKAIAASTSIPLLSTIKKVAGGNYLDGGVADPIPVRRAAEDGFTRQVVVLTRPVGYEKKSSLATNMVSRLAYRKLPNLVRVMRERAGAYNTTLKYIEECEHKGDHFVVRPKESIVMPRISTDREKLKAAYDEGYSRMEELLPSLRSFLSSH